MSKDAKTHVVVFLKWTGCVVMHAIHKNQALAGNGALNLVNRKSHLICDVDCVVYVYTVVETNM